MILQFEEEKKLLCNRFEINLNILNPFSIMGQHVFYLLFSGENGQKLEQTLTSDFLQQSVKAWQCELFYPKQLRDSLHIQYVGLYFHQLSSYMPANHHTHKFCNWHTNIKPNKVKHDMYTSFMFCLNILSVLREWHTESEPNCFCVLLIWPNRQQQIWSWLWEWVSLLCLFHCSMSQNIAMRLHLLSDSEWVAVG